MLKHVTLFLFLGFFSFSAIHGQEAENDYHKADSLANLNNDYDTVKELANFLSVNLSTDAEKARAFFIWLVENVRYDCHKYHNPSNPTIKARSEEEYQNKLEDWQEKQLEKTLKRKRGVCADYSRLFKALCDHAGLEAKIIRGNARDFNKPGKSVLDNSHAWNAVKIDGEWKLLDATWGAGFVNAGATKFTKKLKSGYFFTPPGWLLQTHYPNEAEWQLVDEELSKKEFADQPMINIGQYDYQLLDFAPKTEQVDGKKHIWFAFEKAPKYFMVTSITGKPVKFEQFEQEGRVYLSFSSTRIKRIKIFARDSQRSRGDWIAMYVL